MVIHNRANESSDHHGTNCWRINLCTLTHRYKQGIYFNETCVYFLISTYAYAHLYSAFIKKLLQQKIETSIKLTL